jgi:hypothetical protein
MMGRLGLIRGWRWRSYLPARDPDCRILIPEKVRKLLVLNHTGCDEFQKRSARGPDNCRFQGVNQAPGNFGCFRVNGMLIKYI